MYVAENVEKFLADHELLETDRGKAILERAKKCAVDGKIYGASIAEIMQDRTLEQMFNLEATTDPEHAMLWVEVMQRQGGRR